MQILTFVKTSVFIFFCLFSRATATSQSISILDINLGMSVEEIVRSIESNGLKCENMYGKKNVIVYDKTIQCSDDYHQISIYNADRDLLSIYFSCSLFGGCDLQNQEVFLELPELIDLSSSKPVYFPKGDDGGELRTQSMIAKTYCPSFEAYLCEGCYETTDQAEYLCVHDGRYDDGWWSPALSLHLDKSIRKEPMKLAW